MQRAEANIIDFNAFRSRRQHEEEVLKVQAEHSVSPGSLLSLNLANWVAASFGDSASLSTLASNCPDIHCALYFARARVFYYRGLHEEAAQMFRSVAESAENVDLKALALLSWANAMYSQGEFGLVENLTNQWPIEEDLSVIAEHALSLLKGNVLYAMGKDEEQMRHCFRVAFSPDTQSLWMQNLQHNLAGFVPMNSNQGQTKGIRRLRDVMDAFIESSASQYFVDLISEIK